MQRLPIGPRQDWQKLAQDIGFIYHSPDGKPYWDESAYYAFSLREIEDQIEKATEELTALCKVLVDRCVRDQRSMERLRIPRHAWDLIATSWRKAEPSLYGRFDFAYDGVNPPKLLEFNADTPTALFEAAVFQWQWLEGLRGNALPSHADQFNSIHEKLIARWRAVAGGKHVHLTCMSESAEDTGNIAYLTDCALQAGVATSFLDVTDVGLRSGRFVDLENREIEVSFKLYPWEFVFADEFGKSPALRSTRFVEPAWKSVLSNKGALALLWEMAPRHPNLLPTYFADELDAGALGRRYAQKPIWSREGANVTLIDRGKELERTDGTYGSEGFVRQALAVVPAFDGNYPVLGSWLIGDQPAGMGIREDRSRITGNLSRFIPHAIL